MWIGSSSYGPHTASFVPPHHTRVAAAIDDLVRFIRRDDLPVLAQAALAHAQFETIHPFPHGNRRTGRALVHCLLRGKLLTRRVIVPVSAGLLTDTDSYFDALAAYRDAWSDSITSRRQAIVWHRRPVEATIPQCVASEHQLVAEVVVVGDFDDQLGQNGN